MFGTRSGMLEPLGHRSADSKLERYWCTVADPQSLERHRTSVFDTDACMSMAPMRYVTEPLTFRSDVPSDDWLVESLLTFVRNEFPARTSRPEPPGRPKLTHREVGAEFLQEFLYASEKLDQVLKPGGDSSDDVRAMATSIYRLLCDPRIGSTRNRANNDPNQFVDELVETIERQSRLLFVLPGFPFKDQNRFRVPYSAEEPDLADISFLIRLHRLTQALYQVHPYGADILILSDGSLYAELFKISMDSAERYLRRIKAYRNQLNLQGTISVIPLRDLLARSDAQGLLPLDVASEIERRLRSLAQSTVVLKEVFADLTAGMKRNINSKLVLADLEDDEARQMIYSTVVPANSALAERWYEFEALCEDAAYRYSAVNLSIRWLDVITSHFPGAIRGTVHPKPGQFALAGSGGAYAWNGVAVSNSWPRTIDDVKVSPFFALADHSTVIRVSFDDGLPAFFMPGAG